MTSANSFSDYILKTACALEAKARFMSLGEHRLLFFIIHFPSLTKELTKGPTQNDNILCMHSYLWFVEQVHWQPYRINLQFTPDALAARCPWLIEIIINY